MSVVFKTMAFAKKTGVILSFENDSEKEMKEALIRLAKSIDAVHLKEPILLRGSYQIIGELKGFMRKNNFDKPIIIDYRLDPSELDSVKMISALLKNEGAYGMTIMAVYNEEFIKSCVKQAEIAVFAIVDIGLQSFRDRFNDESVANNALSAKKNDFAGVIMTSQHVDRIRYVRGAIGASFPLLSTLERDDKMGSALSAGADFEIVPSKCLKK